MKKKEKKDLKKKIRPTINNTFHCPEMNRKTYFRKNVDAAFREKELIINLIF